MNIPAPTPIENRRSAAVSLPFGWIPRELLSKLEAEGKYLVVKHQLGSEAARQNVGPSELARETIAALESIKWSKMWSLGGICRSVEDAAHFATAGYTWMKLELGSFLDPRAKSLTLEQLDAAIVALEDEGILDDGWHEPYTQSTDPDLDDESIARWGVRFGLALKEAEQMIQAIRMNTPLKGEFPDLEFSFAGALEPFSAKDFAMLIFEMKNRGFFHDLMKLFSPPFGPSLETGMVELSEVPEIAKPWKKAATPIGTLYSIPSAVTEEDLARNAHIDYTEACNLMWLRHLATTDPTRFREWLLAARDAFPTAKVGHHLSISEDEVRLLPDVADDALVATFLDHNLGRQLLACTWQDVCDVMGDQFRK